MLIAGMLFFSGLMAGAGEPAADIHVWPGEKAGTADSRLYGHFLEHIYDSVVDGLDGQIVRCCGFEEAGSNLGEGVTVVNGEWAFAGDVLEASGMDAHAIFGLGASEKQVFSVEARKTSGSEGFLILFRVRDKGNFYWWNLGGWGNQWSAVEHEVNGGRSAVEGTRTDTRIEAGRWYTIRVEMEGSRAVCMLDGKTVVSFNTEDTESAGAGLGVWATQAEYRNARLESEGGGVFRLEPPARARAISGLWKPWPEDAPGMNYRLAGDALSGVRCQEIESTGDGGGIMQDNLPVNGGVAYEGSVWLRGRGTVEVSLDGGGGQTRTLAVDAGEWTEYPLAFSPKTDTDKAVLRMALKGEGKIQADLLTLRRADMPYRPAVYNRVRDIAPAFLRWPGGCYAEHYRWRDGVGPRRERTPRPNYIWGGIDPNLFGTAEFARLCRDLPSEPVIVLNIGHHEPQEQEGAYIQEALDWIEYCNGATDTPMGALRARHGHPAPFNVRFWEIGNETWPMGVEAYAARACRFVDAIRAKFPAMNLKFLLCGSGGMDLEWNRRMIGLAGTRMDWLSTHHYMEGSFADEMKNGADYPEFLHQTARIIAASPTPEVKIACTEWNQQSVKLRTGLYAGLVLNGFERHGGEITMSCPALFIRKVGAAAWDNAFINHDSFRTFVAPNYLVMKLYRDNFSAELVRAEAPAPLNLVASKIPGGKGVILKVVNPSADTAVAARVTVEGVESPAFRQWRVWSDSIDDMNTLDTPERIRVEESETGAEVNFPAHSVTILRSRE